MFGFDPSAKRTTGRRGILRDSSVVSAKGLIEGDHRPELEEFERRAARLLSADPADLDGSYARCKALARLREARCLLDVALGLVDDRTMSLYLYGSGELVEREGRPMVAPRAPRAVMTRRAERLLALAIDDLRPLLAALVVGPAAGTRTSPAEAARRLYERPGRMDRWNVRRSLLGLLKSFSSRAAAPDESGLSPAGKRWARAAAKAALRGDLKKALAALPHPSDPLRAPRAGSWLALDLVQLRIALKFLVEGAPAWKGDVQAFLRLLHGPRHLGRQGRVWSYARREDGVIVKRRYASRFEDTSPGGEFVPGSEIVVTRRTSPDALAPSERAAETAAAARLGAERARTAPARVRPFSVVQGGKA